MILMMLMILLIHHAILIEASVLSVTIHLIGLLLLLEMTLVAILLIVMLSGLEICICDCLLVFLALM